MYSYVIATVAIEDTEHRDIWRVGVFGSKSCVEPNSHQFFSRRACLLPSLESWLSVAQKRIPSHLVLSHLLSDKTGHHSLASQTVRATSFC